MWGRIGALKARKQEEPDLVIGLLGCMANEHKEWVQKRMPHIDLVLGTMDFGAVDRFVDAARTRRRPLMAVGKGSSGDRNRLPIRSTSPRRP